MNPFDLLHFADRAMEMRGPRFLDLYFFLTIGALLLALTVRWLLSFPWFALSREEEPLDVYQLALLAGGADLAGYAALTCLQRNGVVQFTGPDKAKVKLRGDLPPDAHALEKGLFRRIPTEGTSYEKLAHAAHEECGEALEILATKGYRMGTTRARLRWVLPVVLCAFVGWLGFAKMSVGVSRDRPIFFLFLMTWTFVYFAGLATLRGWHDRTSLGEATLRAEEAGAAALESSARSNPHGLGGRDLARAVALFHTDVLGVPGSAYYPFPATKPWHTFSETLWEATKTFGSLLLIWALTSPRRRSYIGSSSYSSCSSYSSSSSCGGGGGGGCGGCGA
jgi:uncharacterized protein (TIGR04222 family)